jgi:hypothetical protein
MSGPAAKAAGPSAVVTQASVDLARRDHGPRSHGQDPWPWITREGGVMAKYHARPSAQYRYEHYDPR